MRWPFHQISSAVHAVCVVGLVGIGCISMPVASKANDFDILLKHFETIVFGNEIEGVDGATKIQKWVSPIRVSVTAMQGQMLTKNGGARELKLSYVRPDPAHVAMIRKHLTELVKLTGTTSEKTDKENGKPANFMIRFVPRLAMGEPFLDPNVDPQVLARLATPGVCYFVTRAIRSGAMFRALIVANADLPPAQMDACLLKEMTQAMGLPNDSDVIAPSIFNQASTQRELSDSDKIILRALYDRRLPAGTPAPDAANIARDLLRDYAGG
jgi:hypothetical protein